MSLKWGSCGSGDGQLDWAQELAIDTNQFVYVVDGGNNRVQVFDPNGSYLRQWGEYGPGDGQFYGPCCIAIDDENNVYVGEEGDWYEGNCISRIQKFTTDGEFILKWGSCGSGDGQFQGPTGIVYSGGYIYVYDVETMIQKFTKNGQFVSRCGSRGIGNGQFIDPQGIGAGSTGNIYVADMWNSRVQIIGADCAFINKIGFYPDGDGQFSIPLCIAIDNSGDIYVADTGNNRVQVIDTNGNYLRQWGAYGTGDGQFDELSGITVSGIDSIYVVDSQNKRIQKFNSAGVFMTKWGNYGSEDGQFRDPEYIAIDSSGYVYVTDSELHRVQKFTSDGVFVLKWGGYGSGDGELNVPRGIAVYGGNVYVADTGNCRVQVFNPNGVYLRKWGNCGTGDGEFNNPHGIGTDCHGNVYVVDTQNNRIQMFDPNGVFILKWGHDGIGNGEFKWPYDIAVNCLGDNINIYVADSLNNRIQKFTYSPAVYFTDYFSVDPEKYGIKTYQWTYGKTGQFTERIAGAETVPYTSGAITGARITNFWDTNSTTVVSNDGNNVKFLGYEDYYLSTDCSLTDHPNGWSLNALYDGMIIDQGTYCWVKNDLSDCIVESDQILLISVQDVNVLNGMYKDAVIIWWIDKNYTYTPLNFHGKEFDLGIILPTSYQTNNYSVTDIEIYGFGTGQIAYGDISASTGILNDLNELYREESPNWMQVNIDGFGDANNLAAGGFTAYDGYMYVGTVNEATGGEVWRYDGSSWNKVNIPGLISNNEAILVGPEYKGNLYIGTSGGEVWQYKGTAWAKVNTAGFGDVNNSICSMVVYNNCLFVGTSKENIGGCEVWKYDGASWTQVNTDGFGDSNNEEANGLVEYNGCLYAGVTNESTGCEIWQYNGTTWTQVNTDGFGDGANQQDARGMAVYNGCLYVGTENKSSGCEVWKFSGSGWIQVNTNGFGDINNEEAIGMAVYNGHLFVGTETAGQTGAEVWQYDGSTWTQANTDGFRDSNNICAFDMGVYNNCLYVGTENDYTGVEVWSLCKPSAPFQFTLTPTYMFVYGEAFIDGLPVETEDWIGVFAGGVSVNNGCIGAIQIDEEGNYTVAVYGNDTSTPEKDGADYLDTLSFKAWDSGKGEYIGLCSADTGIPRWTGHNEIININLTDNCMLEQIIPLSEGWNLISYQARVCFYEDEFPAEDPNLFIISPNEVDFIYKESLNAWLLDDANSPIRDAADPNKAGDWQRITSFDHEGAHLLDKDLPEYVNTLHYFSLGYGYWIKMNKDGYLVMQGQPATADISLNLKTGWSLMGFIPPDICYAKDPNAQAQICPYKIGIYQQAEGIAFCPVDPFPQTPLASISGKYQRITSFDTCDGAKLYDKDLPDFVNTLDYIGPKYGYWIKMLEDGKQVYPDECPESPPLVSISDYYTWTPGEIRVYHGTWDTDDIWIEICGNQFNTMVDGNTRLVYPIEKYQLNNEQTSAYIVFTAYEYADEQSWILWKEISAGSGNEFIQNYALFDHNMAIGDTTSSGSELLEVSERVFPELSAGSLEYVKFKVPPPEGYEELWGVNFWIVYFVKGYGEYVLQPDETDFSIVQRYLIYSTSGVGNKPDWFDNIFN